MPSGSFHRLNNSVYQSLGYRFLDSRTKEEPSQPRCDGFMFEDVVDDLKAVSYTHLTLPTN